MDQVITFDKSLQQRLQEYNDVLAGYDILPVSALENEFSYYLELTADPDGWQAVWKIQRKTCETLNIPFPSIVLVLVLNLDCKNLAACVKVLAVQDDIHIPDKHYVPLKQLWPTKDQDKTIPLNLHSTANSIDMLRFFYNNLLMPWDHDDDTVDWRSKHLENRLRLYYDMNNGVLPRPAAEHLHSLISEAKRLQGRQELLEVELQDHDDPDQDNVNDRNVQALVELHIRMKKIKSEVEILENPLLRGVIIKNFKTTPPAHDGMTQNIWVIYGEGTAGECIQFLSKIEAIYPKEILKFSPQLIKALECAPSNDVFIVNESIHLINTTSALENGGTLKGISTFDKTILTSKAEDVMLDFQGENVLLENLTIQATTPQCAIIVRRGSLTMNNCKLIGDGKSSTHQGIIVLKGANLEIVDCEINGFCTAVIGNSGSEIVIENSKIYDCNFGLKIFDNCAVKATKAVICNCKDYGVCVETENSSSEDHPKIGDFGTLNIIPTLQMEFVTGNNNTKGDAVINQKSKLKAIEDIFEELNSETAVCIESGSDEEMDIQQTTIIQNVNGISPLLTP